MMKSKLHVLAGIVLMALSCDIGIEPPFELKDPRKIRFTSYEINPTLSTGLFVLETWGSSERNAYIVGFTNGRYGQLWKFDGSTVSEVFFPRPIFGGSSYQLFSIYGFAENNIWCVGTFETFIGNPIEYYDSTAIMHFDGSEWKDVGVRAKGTLQAIWGSSPIDIWAGGTEGTLFHYDGTRWSNVSIPGEMWISSLCGSSPPTVYATAYGPGPSGLDHYYLLHWNGAAWSIQDSSQETTGTEKFGFFDLSVYGNDVFTVGRQGLYKATPSGWVQLLHSTSGAVHAITGTSSSNLILAGGSSLLYHYNGSDFARLSGIPPSVSLYDAQVAGTSLLLVGNDFQSNRSWFFVGN